MANAGLIFSCENRSRSKITVALFQLIAPAASPRTSPSLVPYLFHYNNTHPGNISYCPSNPGNRQSSHRLPRSTQSDSGASRPSSWNCSSAGSGDNLDTDPSIDYDDSFPGNEPHPALPNGLPSQSASGRFIKITCLPK